MEGQVASTGNLPSSGNTKGDAYIVQADDSLHIWDGSAWVSGGSIQGPQGSKGQKGDTGGTGAKGQKGEIGPTGAKGDTGAAGAKGQKGEAGTNGSNGAKGQKGEAGSNGAKGDTGGTGTKGDKGQKGDTGGTGGTGAKGQKGQKGEQGGTGGTGAKGDKGQKGEVGATGSKGQKGDGADIKSADLIFDRASSRKIIFNSDTNYASDLAYILMKDNSSFHRSGTENLRLSIGAYNDFSNSSAHSDAVDIQGGARLYLNAGDWDTELDSAIGAPAIGSALDGYPIQLAVNNSVKVKVKSDGTFNVGGTDVINSSGVWVGSSSGLKGDTGSGGAKGQKGEPGGTGGTGAKGQKGEPGGTGGTGAKGQKGEPGGTGSTGTKGQKGEPGTNGSNGAKGQKGEQGGTGGTGAKGQKGEAGGTGGTGAKGQKGQKGEQGGTGGTGAKGQKGEPGGTGGTGAKGQKGEPGGTGGTGAKGQKGETGAAGGFTTNSNAQINSLGVNTGASGTAGEIRATNNITAYYSDERLKTRFGNIPNALEKIHKLSGFYYEANEEAQRLGYDKKKEIGVSAQEVQSILPEVVVPAPIDDKYLTVHYEKLAALFIEAIKELDDKVNLLIKEKE